MLVPQLTTERPKIRSGNHRRGAAAVEFAIALPILMLLAIGSVDFGRIPYFHQVVANAARTGAETGATHQFTTFTRATWESEIQDAVLAEMQNIPHFDSSTMTYQLTTTVNSDGLNRIVVEVSYPFTSLVTLPGIPSQVQMHKRVEVLQFR